MSVKEIFDTMDYGPALEGDAQAQAWLERHGRRFGQFINGSFTQPTDDGFDSTNPATGAFLARLSQARAEDVDAAVAAARAAQPGWEALGGPARARVLYALARLLQKHGRLFAVLETLDNGKPIRESRDIDIPLAQRHFYFHAGMAQLIESERPGARALGVCGQIIPWNFPLLMLAWKIAPALATGNTVVLKPAEYTSLTAMLFADICAEAGVPAGVVNIVTGDGRVGEKIVAAEVDKIAFTGSTAVGRQIRETTAGRAIALTLELGGKSPYIVFDDADLDSAVEGLVEAIWFNQGQVCCAGSRLLVQESVAEPFHQKLKARMAQLRMGNPLDKCIDLGAVVDPTQRDAIAAWVDSAPAPQVYQPDIPLPETGCFYPPTLIEDLSPADRLMQEEIFGPVLVTTTFRTPAEAVQLANNSRFGLAASIWSETISLALDIAPKLAAGVVWINGSNLFDAAAGFGGQRESGFGREGGWEGLDAYCRVPVQTTPLTQIKGFAGQASGQTVGQAADQNTSQTTGDTGGAQSLDRTAKLYIGGKQARPDSGYVTAIHAPEGHLLGHVGQGSRKDLRNAVESATGAAAWGKTTGHLRAQILYYIAENLSARAAEFAARLDGMTGTSGGAAEVEACLQRLFTAAAWADKYDGQVHGVPIRGVALAMKEPVGVIAALCPDDAPLLGLVSLMAPAIAMGNRMVLAASEPFPLAATDFYQVLDTSDVPAGVVNILTGTHAELAPAMASHMNIDAIWSHSSSDLSQDIERASQSNLKRSWVNNGRGLNWMEDHSKEILREASEIKNIWIPYGA